MNSFLRTLWLTGDSTFATSNTNSRRTMTSSNVRISGILLPLCRALSLWLWCFLVVAGSQPDQLTKRDFEMIFENFTCVANESTDIVKSLHCGLGKNNKRRTLQLEMSFKRELVDFQLDILILLPRAHENFVLLNLTQLSGCDFLSNRNQVTLIYLTRSNLDRYSNFPSHCPLQQLTKYYIRGYRWDMDMIPSLTIETEVHIWVNYFVERVKIIESFVSCRLIIKQAKKEQLTAAIFNEINNVNAN